MKCSVAEFGKSARRIAGNYSLGNKKNNTIIIINTITNTLLYEKHTNKITGEMHNQMKNIKMAFTYINADMIKKLITSMIRSRLEYAALIWSPSLKKEIRKLERIQRAATRIPSSLRGYSYEERLERLGLITLEKRRERGDLIPLHRMRERGGGKVLLH